MRRTHHRVAFLVTLLCWWASYSAVSATTRYVCRGACTYASIRDAVVAAEPDDIVQVAGGTYSEDVISTNVSVTIETSALPVVIMSSDLAPLSQWLVINSNTTVRLNGSFQLVGSLHVNGGTLETYGTLNITAGPNSQELLRVSNQGHWVHHGHAELTATSVLNAIRLQGGNWNQSGSARITTQNGPGVLLIPSGGDEPTWNQFGSTELVVTMSFGDGADVGGSWVQEGTLDVTVSNSAAGITVRPGYVYIQRNTSSFHLDSRATGISVWGQWTQRDFVRMIVGQECTGVELHTDQDSWRQQGRLALDVTGSSAAGVSFIAPTAKWEQVSGAVEIHVTGIDSAGVHFSASGQRWEQSSNVTITVPGADSCGVDLGTAGPSVWKQSVPKPIVRATGLGSVAICPAPLPSLSVEAVKALINDTTPSVVVAPRDSAPDAVGQKAQVDFLSLREVTPAGDLVWAAQLQDGWVRTGNGTSNVSSTTTFTSRLANNATLVYEFATFEADTDLTLANNYTFSVTPAFLKFSLRLDRWNWSSTDNKLEFQMVIDPPFATPEVRANTPQANTTAIFLPSGDESQGGTLVRLLDFGLTNTSQRVACSSAADAGSSSITITFAHFDSDLDYDPDISLLLGGRKDDDGGGGGTEWVIAVAVAIPVAVAVVALVIVVALTVTFVRRRRRTAALAVNFDNDGRDGGAEEL